VIDTLSEDFEAKYKVRNSRSILTVKGQGGILAVESQGIGGEVETTRIST
jgi:hypothetical protein